MARGHHGPFNNTANFPLRDYATQKRWPCNREGGGDKGGYQKRLKQLPGRPDPAGQGCTERSLKYSSVRREIIGTSTIVRGKGGGGQTERQAPQESRGNSSVDEGTLSRTTPTGRVEGLKTIAGGAVSFAPPPTPKPSTPSRTGRGGCNPADGTLGRTPG